MHWSHSSGPRNDANGVTFSGEDDTVVVDAGGGHELQDVAEWTDAGMDHALGSCSAGSAHAGGADGDPSSSTTGCHGRQPHSLMAVPSREGIRQSLGFVEPMPAHSPVPQAACSGQRLSRSAAGISVTFSPEVLHKGQQEDAAAVLSSATSSGRPSEDNTELETQGLWQVEQGMLLGRSTYQDGQDGDAAFAETSETGQESVQGSPACQALKHRQRQRWHHTLQAPAQHSQEQQQQQHPGSHQQKSSVGAVAEGPGASAAALCTSAIAVRAAPAGVLSPITESPSTAQVTVSSGGIRDVSPLKPGGACDSTASSRQLIRLKAADTQMTHHPQEFVLQPRAQSPDQLVKQQASTESYSLAPPQATASLPYGHDAAASGPVVEVGSGHLYRSTAGHRAVLPGWERTGVRIKKCKAPGGVAVRSAAQAARPTLGAAAAGKVAVGGAARQVVSAARTAQAAGQNIRTSYVKLDVTGLQLPGGLGDISQSHLPTSGAGSIDSDGSLALPELPYSQSAPVLRYLGVSELAAAADSICCDTAMQQKPVHCLVEAAAAPAAPADRGGGAAGIGRMSSAIQKNTASSAVYPSRRWSEKQHPQHQLMAMATEEQQAAGRAQQQRQHQLINSPPGWGLISPKTAGKLLPDQVQQQGHAGHREAKEQQHQQQERDTWQPEIQLQPAAGLLPAGRGHALPVKAAQGQQQEAADTLASESLGDTGLAAADRDGEKGESLASGTAALTAGVAAADCEVELPASPGARPENFSMNFSPLHTGKSANEAGAAAVSQGSASSPTPAAAAAGRATGGGNAWSGRCKKLMAVATAAAPGGNATHGGAAGITARHTRAAAGGQWGPEEP
eukprot:gene4777-5028_t